MAPLGNPEELLRIINQRLLTSVFQPIVALQSPELYGYEALIRGPANSVLHTPLHLFDTASRHGMMAPLEYACRQESCHRFSQFGGKGKLFLNISPMSLTEHGYQRGVTHSILDQLEIPPERIVIELSEQYPLDDYNILRHATNHFRSEGFEIAIDDLGAGYAGLRAWSELRPDYVKIDRHFIEHISVDPVKREFVKSIHEIAQGLNCKVVAEGIETKDDLATVRQLGIEFGQGFFIGRPEKQPETSSNVLERIVNIGHKKRLSHRGEKKAEEICLANPSIAPDEKLGAVAEIFQHNRDVACLPVIEQQRPIGMVERSEFLELFAQQYTRSLHGRKPVSEFMLRTPIIISHDTALEDVSRLLTDNGDDQLAQHFIITRFGKYCGIAKTASLLKQITEQQIRNARYANPLTLLPGNVPIAEHLERCIANKKCIHVAYFDLNHFKPFNDYFGYNIGDKAITLVANILQKNTNPESDFVGHIGGDDFVVIFEEKDWNKKCLTMLHEFGQNCRQFYNSKELADGGIWSKSRSGQKQFFPLLSLACGVTNPDPERCLCTHDIATLSSEAKQQAKMVGGNGLYLNQRRFVT